MVKSLEELIRVIPEAKIQGRKDRMICHLAHDSRKVIPGTLFICFSGAKADGHQFIMQARQKGAVAVLVEKEVEEIPEGLTVIRVGDTRAVVRVLAPYFYDYPARKLRMIGITGTNGKTTTTYLLKSIFNHAGYKVGIIGTIQVLIEETVLPTANTTPDVIDLQGILAQMVDAGMDYVVMEVSSHALALDRIAGCEFDVGIFTNITQDHLDFHQTFENYLAAKTRLFQLISSGNFYKEKKAAIINVDDPASASIRKETHCRTITYGLEERADLTALNTNIQANGTGFDLKGEFGVLPIAMKITGKFNVYNVLAAVGAAQAEGIGNELIKIALEKFQSVPGRFELVNAGQDFTIIIDYAHTPDGLENILKTAQQIAMRRIIVVFGCGGDRDRTKRPIMGKLAAIYGDVIIATSDNPRSEDPSAILSEIEVGIQAGLTSDKLYEKIVDRRQAISKALHLAKQNDIVIIAGKGHENYQILKDRTIHFDDKEVAMEIVGELK
jgi:UDP-N-acetylmuramoyl-L-alanyl-D-glutamate--2,6-diaminopimelate ligase/murE/murF fusion protein